MHLLHVLLNSQKIQSVILKSTHALHFMENMKKIKYDALMLLQPTAPFRNEKHIDEAIRIFLQSGASSLASVRGPYKKREINLKKVNGDSQNLIPQNEQYYIYNAAIYIILRENCLKLCSLPVRMKLFILWMKSHQLI